MPESPCRKCGEPTVHTADDEWPLCDPCYAFRAKWALLYDITEGRIEVPPLHNEEGEPVD